MARRPTPPQTSTRDLGSTTALAAVSSTPNASAGIQAAKLLEDAVSDRKAGSEGSRKRKAGGSPVALTPEPPVAMLADAPVELEDEPAAPSETTAAVASAVQDVIEEAAHPTEAADRPDRLADNYADAVEFAVKETIPASTGTSAEPAAAEATTAAAERSEDAIASFAALNARVAETMRSNMDAAMSYWTSLMGASSLAQVAALNAQLIRRQLDAFAAQTRDLSSLAWTTTTESPQASHGQPREPSA